MKAFEANVVEHIAVHGPDNHLICWAVFRTIATISGVLALPLAATKIRKNVRLERSLR